MDEATRMMLHDLKAIERSLADAMAYGDRLLAAEPPLPRDEARLLRQEHFPHLQTTADGISLVAQRIRASVSTPL